MSQKILIATTNQGKYQELVALLCENGVRPCNFISLLDLDIPIHEPKESGATLEENATIKAISYHEQTKMKVIADDSGLFVDALKGEPGIKSKRWGNSDKVRVDRLLAMLDGFPREKRTASFNSSLAYCQNPNHLRIFTGTIQGIISTSSLGNRGFGYDPIFVIPQLEKTFAQMTAAQKNKLSHRAQAAKKLADYLTHLCPVIQN
jgi:XTP/dITP diphosphohydrolase